MVLVFNFKIIFNLGVKLSNFWLLMMSSDVLIRRVGDIYGYVGM